MLTLEQLGITVPEEKTYERIPFGKEMRKEFQFGPGWRNMNHGSFGATPAAVSKVANHLREQSEARPDTFILYAYPQLLDKSRAAVASLLNVPTDTCVFVPNATTGVNTVLRSITWNADGLDEVLYFSTVYAACGKTVLYVSESTGQVSEREIKISFPLSHASYVKAFKDAIVASKAAGKRPRLAIFDTVTSVPGCRVPHEDLLSVCASNGILSLIDGAHGVGHIPLDLSALKPDFFVSNCHKWLFVPRGCCVLHVPIKNQHYIRSTLPTSHGFVPKENTGLPSPLPPNSKPAWVANFEFVGTADYTPFCVVAEAIKWRQEACGGEAAIFSYCNALIRNGSKIVSDALGGGGANVLQNKEGEGDFLDCQFAMVRLPIWEIAEEDNAKVLGWLKDTMVREYETFIFFTFWQGWFWVRLASQVYLEEEDFRWAGETLRTVCERVREGEWKKAEGVQIHDLMEASGKALE